MPEWFETVRPLLSGLAAAGVVALLGRFGMRAQPDSDGWRTLRPSAMHWAGVVIGSAMAAVTLYERLFVGSATSDAETQMNIATILVGVFGVITIICAVKVIRLLRDDVRWRGSTLSYRDRSGSRVTRPMSELIGMDRLASGTVVLAFEDGSLLKFDLYAKGTPELWNRIATANADWVAAD